MSDAVPPKSVSSGEKFRTPQGITAIKDGVRHFEVKEEECVGCNLCVSVCPVEECITLRHFRPEFHGMTRVFKRTPPARPNPAPASAAAPISA